MTTTTATPTRQQERDRLLAIAQVVNNAAPNVPMTITISTDSDWPVDVHLMGSYEDAAVLALNLGLPEVDPIAHTRVGREIAVHYRWAEGSTRLTHCSFFPARSESEDAS